jgi:hypothetical protein
MRTNWKSRLLIGALAAATLAAPAVGQIGIVIGRNPPPPMRYERRPPMPGAGYVWVDGYWNWAGGRYVWVPGRWDRAPYAGAYWSHPHYDRYEDGWHYHGGHWDREDHGDHYYDNRDRDRDHDRDRDDRNRR